MNKSTEESTKSLNFIEEIVFNDVEKGLHGGRVLTRFPPEPNGYLHIGHAKSICLNFGVANDFGGETNLRFDDTNPVTEDTEYVDSIKNDVKWLGFNWVNEFYASDYFDTFFAYAVKLINDGFAYVEDSTSEEISAMKGTPTKAGTNSPYRDRTPEENLQLFTEMKEGKHAEGSKVLRAKIDMTSNNMLMRDPVIYRIKFAHHHRTADKWCIYPLYDFAHGQSDSIEEVTHSICTLEFVAHREVYNWFIEKLEMFPSKQYEFARLNITYTVLSKRKLLQLVNEKYVSGWDDPRMPTISGIRRRGYTAAAVRNFCERIGVAKRDNLIDIDLLEFFVREDLNKIATRAMAILNPLKVVITNMGLDETEICPVVNNPEAAEQTSHDMIFRNEIYIERDDFMEEPFKKYNRLKPGGVVRLKGAFIIEFEDMVKDADGNITELHCKIVENSKSGSDTSGVRAKGTIQWVSVADVVEAEIRQYDRLFKAENVDAAEGDFKDQLNESSLVKTTAFIEPFIKEAIPEDYYQFMRMGYFVLDKDSADGKLIFNRTVELKSSWK
jgi:glutaminyl-tRNA synthetase